MLKSNGHSIQALLGADNTVSTANNNKTLYTIPTYLQAHIPTQNGEHFTMFYYRIIIFITVKRKSHVIYCAETFFYSILKIFVLF